MKRNAEEKLIGFLRGGNFERIQGYIACDQLLERCEKREQSGVGVAQVLFALGEKGAWREADEEGGKHLARGARLSFVWRRGDRSEVLGERLRELSERVKREVGRAMERDLSEWELCPHHTIERFWARFGGGELGLESGYLSLAAALRLAALSARSAPHVFITGCWGESGVEPVTGIEAKLEAIGQIRLGEQRPQVFVPRSNYAEALTYQDKTGWVGEILPLDGTKTSLEEVLKPVLRLLDMPPTKDDSFEERVAYANRPYMENSPARRSYYSKFISKDLAIKLREVKEEVREELDVLVMVLSTSTELAVFLSQLLEPERLILFVTEKTREHRERVTEALSTHVGKVVFREMDELREVLSELTERSVCDVTSGTAWHSAAMTELARRAGCRCAYLHHDYDEYNRPVYSIEKTHLERFSPPEMF